MSANDQSLVWKTAQVKDFQSRFPKYLKATEVNTGSGIGQYNAMLQNEGF
jgi:hypothetical protein